MNPRRIFADLKVVVRSYLRNPVALFFSLIFPIILIALFGTIFSAGGSGAVPLAVENLDHNSPTSVAFLAALNNTSLVKVTLVNYPVASFSSQLGDNGYSVGLLIPAGFQANYTNRTPVDLTLFTNPENGAAAGQAEGAVSGIANGFNLRAVCGGGSCAPVIQVPPSKNIGSQVYTYIDYLIPGLIGFSILTSPMFSMVDIASSYRKEGIFRELSLTPLTKSEWLLSRISWYVVLTFITAAIMIGAGVGLFGAHVEITLGLVPYLIVGPFLFVALGMLAGTVARTPESAALIGNIITFPMMFLSGTFFAVSMFPSGLQVVAHVLPLYYVIDGMDQVMLFSNTTRALFDVGVVAILAVIVFALAVRFFQWRDVE
ncbi:MAG: ABC transporter permease [Thermoplasmata archaeon]|nr:ABC transporter permease [Thermoplasmata archaeon]